MIEGRLTPKPVGKACSFVGAPRSHSAPADHRHDRSQAALEGHGSRRHRYGRSLRHLALFELAVCRRQRSSVRHCPRLQQLARAVLQRRSAPPERRRRSRRFRTPAKPSKNFGAPSKISSLSPSQVRRFQLRKKISTIRIYFRFLPRRNVSMYRFAFTSAPVTAFPRPRSVSIIRSLPMRWRIHSSK